MGVNQIVEKAEGYGWHKNDSIWQSPFNWRLQKHNQGSWGAGRDDAPDSQKQLLLLHPGWSAEYNIQDRKSSPQELYGPVTEVTEKFKPIHFKNIWLFTFYGLQVSAASYELFQLSQKIQEADSCSSAVCLISWW